MGDSFLKEDARKGRQTIKKMSDDNDDGAKRRSKTIVLYFANYASFMSFMSLSVNEQMQFSKCESIEAGIFVMSSCMASHLSCSLSKE